MGYWRRRTIVSSGRVHSFSTCQSRFGLIHTRDKKKKKRPTNAADARHHRCKINRGNKDEQENEDVFNEGKKTESFVVKEKRGNARYENSRAKKNHKVKIAK